MKRTCVILTALLLLMGACKSKTSTSIEGDSDPNTEALSDVVLNVDITDVISSTADDPIGINFNYLRDDNHNRPEGAQPIQDALKEMGVRYLRYPGGEKSDYLLWSKPPWDAPDPQVYDRTNEKYVQHAEGHDLLDFDEYMAYVREVGAEPYVTVGASPFGGYNDFTKITREQYLENAVEWVRYANIEKEYGIKYWEIGNENWVNPIGDADFLAGLADEFGTAMKAVDPGIKVGISTAGGGADPAFVRQVPDVVDFLSMSGYHGHTWEGYQQEADHDLAYKVREAVRCIEEEAPDPARERLFVAVAELNAIDFQGDWARTNDLGHGIVVVDMIGQMLMLERVEIAMFWNTRWMDDGTPNSLWYALDPYNRIRPTGRGLAIWGQFLLDRLVHIDRLDRVVTWATASNDGSKLNIIIINKDDGEHSVSINLNSGLFNKGTCYEWSGSGHEDTDPAWGIKFNEELTGPYLNLDLPAVSVTVLELGS